MESVTLHVPNISCGHCVKTIQRVVLDEVPGVATVSGDHETKTVTITFDAPATLDAIVATMTEWNYAPDR